MIEFDQAQIQEAIDDIDGLEDALEETTRKRGRYSLYQQIERTVDREVTSPILQRARELGAEHVGDRVTQITPADGRWTGNQYRTGLKTDNTVVLAHEFGSGQYGRGNGKYKIEPSGGKDALAFTDDGKEVVVEWVVHPGVRGKRFMQQAIREHADAVQEELEDDVQETLEDAIERA